MTETPESRRARQALRTLVLPLQAAGEETAVRAAETWLASRGVPPADWAAWIELQRREWERARTRMPPALRDLIRIAIEAGFPNHGTAMARHYRRLHADLQASNLGFAEASTIISYAPLVATLHIEHGMSAAQIARVIEARSEHLQIHWEVIQRVLRSLELHTGPPDEQSLRDLCADDQSLVAERVGDATLRDGPDILAEVGGQLGFRSDLCGLLEQLVPPAGDPHTAYLQILHLQLVLSHFHDHPATITYEFRPRGDRWRTVYFDPWPEGMRAGESPILNNAKSVYRLDKDWARAAKTSLRPAAYALVELLEELDAMPHLARQELASWLRVWLLRVIELLSPPEREVPSLTVAGARSVLEAVADEPTGTKGIIEQRILDAVATLQHPPEDGWRSRGVGDSVFAPNLFRRKLGDCDFQSAERRQAVAFEAHGGSLSEVYLHRHMETLRRVLPLRAEEWRSTIDDPVRWDVNIKFVAHQHALSHPPELDPDHYAGVPTRVELQTFAEAIEGQEDSDGWLDVFRQFVHVPLTGQAAREEVFIRYRQLLLRGEA